MNMKIMAIIFRELPVKIRNRSGRKELGVDFVITFTSVCHKFLYFNIFAEFVLQNGRQIVPGNQKNTKYDWTNGVICERMTIGC